MPVNSRARSRKSTAGATAGIDGSQAALAAVVLDPIITMDEDGVIRSASESVEQVFGWTPTELFGRNVKVLIPEPRRSALDRYLDRYRNADTSKSLTRARRFDAVRKDGTLFQIELSMSRADLPVHSAPFFIGIVRDVSRQIDISADSVDARSRMHDLITEQTRALASAHLRLQLADRMAALGTLAAGLGHDLNNVLLPLRARLDAMEHAGSAASIHTHMKAVRQQVAYLQSLSDGLNALVLDPDGPGDLDAAGGTTMLSDWWAQVGPLLRKAVPTHVKVTSSIPVSLPAVGIAPQWLTQAMLNLIVNAGESLPMGRRAGRIRIWADVARDGRTVRLAVTDNGSGMTREVQRRALDLFFTTKSRSMGTGLGLPLSRKIALRAGGELLLTSHPGKGTTALLQLPAVSRAPRSTSAPGGGHKRAMVSVAHARTAALIGQVLLGAGLELKPSSAHGPGDANVWVTDPTSKAIEAAARWRKRRPTGALAVFGAPPERTLRRWTSLGAFVIGRGDDIRAIRQSLGMAMEKA